MHHIPLIRPIACPGFPCTFSINGQEPCSILHTTSGAKPYSLAPTLPVALWIHSRTTAAVSSKSSSLFCPPTHNRGRQLLDIHLWSNSKSHETVDESDRQDSWRQMHDGIYSFTTNEGSLIEYPCPTSKPTLLGVAYV